jgi:hypothetical protein
MMRTTVSSMRMEESTREVAEDEDQQDDNLETADLEESMLRASFQTVRKQRNAARELEDTDAALP